MDRSKKKKKVESSDSSDSDERDRIERDQLHERLKQRDKDKTRNVLEKNREIPTNKVRTFSSFSFNAWIRKFLTKNYLSYHLVSQIRVCFFFLNLLFMHYEGKHEFENYFISRTKKELISLSCVTNLDRTI